MGHGNHILHVLFDSVDPQYFHQATFQSVGGPKVFQATRVLKGVG